MSPLEEALNRLIRPVEGGGRKLTLTSIAEFMEGDRSLPYSWKKGKSKPSKKAVVGLAFFDLTEGNREKSEEFSQAAVEEKIGEWLALVGYNRLEAPALYAAHSHEYRSIPLNTDDLVPDETTPEDPGVSLAGFLRLAKRLVPEGGQPMWQLILARFSQEVARYRVGHWLNACPRGLGVNYVRGTWAAIFGESADIKDGAVSKSIEMMGDALVPGSRRLVMLADVLGEAPEAAKVQKTAEHLAGVRAKSGDSVQVFWRESLEGSPRYLWLFDDLNPEQRWGQLVLPCLGSTLDQIIESARKPEYGEVLHTDIDVLFWQLTSFPLTFEQAIESLADRGVNFSEIQQSKWEEFGQTGWKNIFT